MRLDHWDVLWGIAVGVGAFFLIEQTGAKVFAKMGVLAFGLPAVVRRALWPKDDSLWYLKPTIGEHSVLSLLGVGTGAVLAVFGGLASVIFLSFDEVPAIAVAIALTVTAGGILCMWLAAGKPRH
jgi:hypothetical protein